MDLRSRGRRPPENLDISAIGPIGAAPSAGSRARNVESAARRPTYRLANRSSEPKVSDMNETDLRLATAAPCTSTTPRPATTAGSRCSGTTARRTWAPRPSRCSRPASGSGSGGSRSTGPGTAVRPRRPAGRWPRSRPTLAAVADSLGSRHASRVMGYSGGGSLRPRRRRGPPATGWRRSSRSPPSRRTTPTGSTGTTG